MPAEVLIILPPPPSTLWMGLAPSYAAQRGLLRVAGPAIGPTLPPMTPGGRGGRAGPSSITSLAVVCTVVSTGVSRCWEFNYLHKINSLVSSTIYL